MSRQEEFARLAKEGRGFATRINVGSDYTDEEREFLKVMDRYKREHRRPFPTIREVLGVLKSLGYRKVAEPT